MSTDNLWLEADTLPPVFEEKKALLDRLLKRAIGGLLLESRQRNILTSPYGRPEQPTPLLSLEQFLKNGGLSEPIDGSTNDEPIFSYEYGFDPLKYLADYLKFLHPKNIKQMRDVRNDACDFLRSRAAHAQAQMRCLYDLHDLTRRLRSGIVWGPLIAPSTMPTSTAGTLICACKAAKGGDLVVEVATEPSFLAVERSWKQKVQDESLIQKLALTNLEPAQTYFLRCYLIQERDGEGGDADSGSSSSGRGTVAGTDVSPAEGAVEGAVIEDGQGGVAERFFQSCQFTVAPADEEGSTSAVQVIAVNARSAHAAASTIGQLAGAGIGTGDVADAPSVRAGCCTVSCFLGELFPPSKRPKSSSVSAHHEHQLGLADCDDGWIQYMSFLLHRYSRAFSDPETILHSTSMLMAWHDRTIDSDARLSEEEACMKRFLSDLGKYQKKHGKGANKTTAAAAKNKRSGTAADAVPTAPKLQRPALGTSMEAILQTLPLEVDGQAAAKTVESTDSTSTSACVRQFYYTQMLGPKVQLLVLDHRRGYLGKEQVSWLTETLKSSPATWKLILSGAPFGVGMSMAPAAASAPRDPLTGEPANSESSVAEEQGASETKDHAGEVGHVATSGEKQEQEQESNDAGTEGAPIAGAGAPTVTMTLPPPIEAAGWDEAGRPKLSLQSVIAGLQKAAIADKREKLRFQREQLESKTGEAGGGSALVVPVALAQDCVVDNEGDEKFVDDRLLVESGIVILSSGACIPEDCPKVLPKTLPLGAEVPPFAAAYDPCESGTAFCMEICIGGGEGFCAANLRDSAVWTGDSDAAVEERNCSNQSNVVTAGHTPRPTGDCPAAKGAILQPPASLRPVVSASLGTRVIFGLGDDDDHLPLACASVVSLASDGTSLDVRIVTVSPDGGQAPLFACTLRCGASFVSNAE